MTPAAGTAVLRIEPRVEIGKNNSAKDRSATWKSGDSRGEAGDTAPSHGGSALSKYRGLWRRRRV